MATEAAYTIDRAAADLKDAGLLAGILHPGPGGILSPAATATGAFLGAELDSRRLTAGRLFVALQGEHADGRAFVGDAVRAGCWALTRAWDGTGADPLDGLDVGAAAGGVLLSPRPEAALDHLARCCRRRRRAVVCGVTGSNGKTTTKDLLAAALRGAGRVAWTQGNFNNRLGVPLTLLGVPDDAGFAVIEMGASAVGDIARLVDLARPRIGIITNAAPAHLAEFGSLEGVIRGKGEMVDDLPSDGAAILNADSPGYEAWRARSTAPVISFGRRAGDHRWSWRARGVRGGPELNLDGEVFDVPLPGEHNGANLAAAVLAARAAGAGDEAIRTGLQAFAGSPHRGVVLEIGGRRVLDDSYNANPGSMAAAAQALAALDDAGAAWAALGAMAELGPDSEAIHRDTGRRLAGLGLRGLVAVGDGARGLGRGFDEGGGTAHYCATCEEAAELLARLTAPGDRLLIKGSRSAAMERLLPLLTAACEG